MLHPPQTSMTHTSQAVDIIIESAKNPFRSKVNSSLIPRSFFATPNQITYANSTSFDLSLGVYSREFVSFYKRLYRSEHRRGRRHPECLRGCGERRAVQDGLQPLRAADDCGATRCHARGIG